MTNELSVFKNENFGELHSIKIGDEIWRPIKDFDGYKWEWADLLEHEVKPVCVKAPETVSKAIETKKNEKLLA